MAKYSAGVPGSANSFDFNGETYDAGSTFESDNPCQMLAFYQTFRATNPEMGRVDRTPGFWASVEQACPGGAVTSPPTSTATPSAEGTTPPGTDSPSAQGTPTVPGTVAGTDGDGPTSGTGDDTGTATEPARPPVGEPHPTRSGEPPNEATTGGDPVDLFSGTVYLTETDLDIPNAVLPLSLARLYRSGPGFYGPFGWNWDHNHNLYVRELSTGDIALWRNAHEERFVVTGGGFEPPRGVFEKLTEVAGLSQVLELGAPGGMVMRFERPAGWTDGERIPILWSRDRHGNHLRYSYGTDDHLDKVADDDGRFLAFAYDQCRLLVSVTDHNGRRYVYDHDEENQHLVCVTRPPTTDQPAGSQQRYHYEPAFTPLSLRHNLLRIEDAEGHIYLQNDYEQDPSSWQYGRVVSQLYGGFLYQFCYTQLQYVEPDSAYVNIHSVLTEVLNPNFGLETYTFNFRGDLLDRRYRLLADKSYRVVVWEYDYDGQGNRSKVTRPDGSEELTTYDFTHADPRMRGRLLRKELTAASGFPSPSRIVWRGSYEPQYQLLIEEIDEAGFRARMRYDFDLTPAALTNTGKLMRVVQPDATLPGGLMQHAETAFEYNSRGQMMALVLPDGVRNEFRYGTLGEERARLIEVVKDAAGLAVLERRRYDAFGFVAANIDPNGGVTRRNHNARGQLEKLVRPAIAGATAEQRFHYNGDGYVTRVERPKGSYSGALSDPVAAYIIDEFERDVLGYATRAVLSNNTSESRAISFCNDYRGIAVETGTPDGATLRTVFDERRLPLEEEVIGHDGLRVRARNVYDRAGRMTQQVDVHGSVTTYEYDAFSRVQTVTLPNDTQHRLTWLARDLLSSEEVVGDDGSGVVRQLAFTQHSYDEKGRRVATTVKSFASDPAVFVNLVTAFHYDELDRIIKSVGPRGEEKRCLYDGLARIVVEVDPMGNEEHYDYDANGNVLQRVSHQREPGGAVTLITRRFEYDARNRRTAQVEPDGARVTSVYDDRDRLVEQVDRRGVITRWRYDAFDIKVRQVHDAGGLGIVHQWLVDAMSRVTTYTDPTGESSHYQFDSVGRMTRVEYPGGFVNARTFNGQSQVVREVLGSGVELSYAYDAASRVTSLVDAVTPVGVVAVPTHELRYDGLNRVTHAKTGAEEVVRAFDGRGRLLSETTLGVAIACRYDDVAGQVEKRWPDGRTEVLSHDLNGVLTSVAQTASGGLGAGNGLLATFRASGAAALGDAVYRGNTTITTRYDERKRPTEIAATSPTGLAQRALYRYDSGDLRRVEAIVGSPPKNSYFEFDNCGRVTLAKDGFATAVAAAATQLEHDAAVATVGGAAGAATHAEQWLYDAADARTKHTETGVADQNYTYGPGHRVQSDGAALYTHSTDGALRTGGALTYDVDALGRITAIRSGATPLLALRYDAFGRPSRIEEAGQPTRTLHYLGGFVEQESTAGVPTRQLTLHPATGVPVAYHSSAGTHFALVDGRFNLLGLVNDAGDLVESYRYGSFGTPRIFNGAGAPLATSALGVQPIFGGQRYLAGPVLYLSKKRLMDPRHGLFLSPDPKGYVDSSMLYVYGAQDPINNIDPNGDIIPFIIAAFVIGGALAGAGYSTYDAYHHPDRYEGGWGTLRIFGNVFGGAAIAGIAVVGGEAVLAAGGTGIFASGTAATSLTATQTFVLYGTSASTSGAILRYGFNSMFPDYVNPVTPSTMAFDYVTGGGIASLLRAVAPALPSVMSEGAGGYAPQSWGRFWTDAGGSAPITGQLGPYPGRIGAFLDRIGIRQGYTSTINNLDVAAGNSWFARTDTAWHEGFHAFAARYFPTFRNLSHTTRFWGGAARYPEEVVAYAFGRAAAGRLHGVPFAPIEAFNSLGAYSATQQSFARWFWGTIWASGILATGVGVANAQTPPNQKPPASK